MSTNYSSDSSGYPPESAGKSEPDDLEKTIVDEENLALSETKEPHPADNTPTAALSLTDQVNQIKDGAHQALDQARDTVKTQISEQKDKVVGTLESVTEALHQTGRELHASSPGVVGDYAESLAHQIDRAAGFLKDNDLDALTARLASIARSEPVLFVGGAFVLGILVARFLKSSAPALQP